MKISNQLMVVILMVIGCITCLELYALHLGYDGMILTTSIAAIAGLPTYIITKKIKRKK